MKTLLLKKGVWNVISALSCLLISTTTFGQAQLTSDQPDYAPGSTATFTGTGFEASEQIIMQVLHYDGTPNTGADHDTWMVIADEAGNFTTTWHVCEDDCLGSTLIATADGLSSQLHAEVIFTDGNVRFTTTGLPNSVVVNVSYSYPSVSGSISYTTPGNSSNISPAPANGTIFTYTFPATIASGGDTYTLSPAGSQTATIVNGQNTFTGTYFCSSCVGGLLVTAPTCAQGGAFTITYSPASGGDITVTAVTPSSFPAKKNTGYTITSIASTVNGNTYTGLASITGTTPNTSGYSSTVTLPYSDNTAPVITCPANITLACGASILPANTGTATATDNCTAAGSIIITSTDNIALPGVCGGTIIRTWKAKDASNNETTCQQTITINPAALPTMTALSDTTVACGSVPASSKLNFSNGLSGGCLISGESNNSTFSATPDACGGDVTETWTATDACGRPLQSVSRTIHVSPAALPTMTALSDITVACGSVPASSKINFSNGLSGGCLISGESNNSTFSSTPAVCGGDVTETWTATDACGRPLQSVSRTIHLIDTVAPTITSCAANVTVAPNATGCKAVLADYRSQISANDNCSTVTLTQNPAPGALLPLGENVIVVTASDNCGNSSSCQFTVSVVNTLRATITSSRSVLYYGFNNDQKATITAQPIGGTAPYTIKITMVNGANQAVSPAAIRVGGKLICDFVNASGDEVWTPGQYTNPAMSAGITCGTNSCAATSCSNWISGTYSVDVTLLADARFIATVTDSNGCTYTTPYEQAAKVDAEDVRCFAGNSGVAKIAICHKTGSTKNPCTAICVDQSAVAEHLAHGDFLGKCTSNCESATSNAKSISPFNVIAYPNPSNNQFTFEIESESSDDININVLDVSGRLIKEMVNIKEPNVTFGENLPRGVYIAIVQQGSNQKTIRIVKE